MTGAVMSNHVQECLLDILSDTLGKNSHVSSIGPERSTVAPLCTGWVRHWTSVRSLDDLRHNVSHEKYSPYLACPLV